MNTTLGPIFLLASERSGTNLLRRRLNEWQSSVFGPSPPHLLKHLYYAEPYYGDLTHDQNFLKLIDDALKLCYLHFSPWPIKFTPNDLLHRYNERYDGQRSTVLLMDVLYTLYANSEGFESYFCKDNHLFYFGLPILNGIPNARFIYLHRDPRDYALSQLRRTVTTSNLVYIARLWRDEQIQCIRLLTEPALAEKVYQLSYESFIQNEAEQISQICETFNLKQIPAKKPVDDLGADEYEEWRNLGKATMTDNFNKYKNQMTKKQVQVVEAITWNQMNFLGYRPESPERPRLSKYYRYYAQCRFKSRQLYNKVKARFLKKEEGPVAQLNNRVRVLTELRRIIE